MAWQGLESFAQAGTKMNLWVSNNKGSLLSSWEPIRFQEAL